MRRFLIIFLVFFVSACTSNRNSRNEKVLNCVVNKFFKHYKSEIHSTNRMCVVIRRDANFEAFQVHHIFMWQVSFENLKIHNNVKGRVPYKLERKDSTYFLYYDSQKQSLPIEMIPKDLLEEITVPYTLIEDEWKVFIDTISGRFAVFGRGTTDSCDMNISKLSDYISSDTLDFMLIESL